MAKNGTYLGQSLTQKQLEKILWSLKLPEKLFLIIQCKEKSWNVAMVK